MLLTNAKIIHLSFNGKFFGFNGSSCPSHATTPFAKSITGCSGSFRCSPTAGSSSGLS